MGDDEDVCGMWGGWMCECDVWMNLVYEFGVLGVVRGMMGVKGVNEGKFDATSLLALLGE